jgi:predicted SnoaL-like aldol condensation-catalyzing enzyme/predicted ester cyclase
MHFFPLYPLGHRTEFLGKLGEFLMATPAENKKLVLEAFDTLFNKRDYAKAAEYWLPTYIQHSAHIGPGRDGLFDLVRGQPAELHYENSRIMAEGDYLMLHGRFSGRTQGIAMIAADIVRMENGRLAEHWDVLQDEAAKDQSRSGLPMFGSSFPAPLPQSPSGAPSSLTVEEARRIVAPLYDALTEPRKKDVNALLALAANDDYRSYHTNDESLTREQLAEVFKGLGVSVPDLHWAIKDIKVIGDQIIVRGEATGTPAAEFWGAKPTGKSFKTMAIDIFTVRNGKLSTAHHIENWMTALQQINS